MFSVNQFTDLLTRFLEKSRMQYICNKLDMYDIHVLSPYTLIKRDEIGLIHLILLVLPISNRKTLFSDYNI